MKKILLLSAILISSSAAANDSRLVHRINQLEKRVMQLEEILAEQRNDWKDPILWKRIKKEMTHHEIKRLLGTPNRVEEQIFTSWYYHPTSKLHSYLWFDEGKVLGWKPPE